MDEDMYSLIRWNTVQRPYNYTKREENDFLFLLENASDDELADDELRRIVAG